MVRNLRMGYGSDGCNDGVSEHWLRGDATTYTDSVLCRRRLTRVRDLALPSLVALGPILPGNIERALRLPCEQSIDQEVETT